MVDGAVDLLPYMPGQTLPAFAAGRGKLLDAFLFQARPQFGLAPPFLAVALLPFTQFAVKGTVVLAVAGRQEVGDPHIHANHRGRGFCAYWNDLIVTEGQPPPIGTLVERDAGIDSLA